MTYDAIILNAQVHDVCDLVGFCSDIHQHHRQHQDNLHVHHNQVRSCDELIDQQVVTISNMRCFVKNLALKIFTLQVCICISFLYLYSLPAKPIFVFLYLQPFCDGLPCDPLQPQIVHPPPPPRYTQTHPPSFSLKRPNVLQRRTSELASALLLSIKMATSSIVVSKKMMITMRVV